MLVVSPTVLALMALVVVVLTSSVGTNCWVSAAASSPANRLPPKGSAVPRPLGENEQDGVPKQSDERDVADLRCSACHSVARSVFRRMDKVRTEFKRQPEKLRSYHVLASLGDLCEDDKMTTGIAKDMETKKVTRIFVDEGKEAISTRQGIIKGGWVSTLFTDVCHQIMDRVEDNVMPLYKQGNPNQICKKHECAGVAMDLPRWVGFQENEVEAGPGGKAPTELTMASATEGATEGAPPASKPSAVKSEARSPGEL